MSRIVFMGTPDFAATILRGLMEAGADIGVEIVGVITQPDRPAGRKRKLRPPPVKVLAEERAVPVFQPRRVRKGRLARTLTELAPELVVVAAYGRIVPPDALAVPRLGCVNVHASLLPAWRGAAPIHRAIMNGDERAGVCLMRMAEGLDTGPVYTCRETPIGPEDTAETLHDRLAEIGSRLIVESLPALLEGGMEPQAQDEAAATTAPPLRKEEGAIDWSESARALKDRVRGLYPWPGAFTWYQGTRLKLFPHLDWVPSAPRGAAPGTILQVEKDGLVVACGDSAVRVNELQEPGRRRMSVSAFLAGHAVRQGDVFTSAAVTSAPNVDGSS